MLILWLKAFHVVAVVTWFAGLFYLPRLLVYHAEASEPVVRERFKVMERRLLKGIMNPSMIAVWILGPLLAWLTGAYLDTWLQVKFVLVVIMSGLHGCYVRWWRDFANDRNTRSARFYKIVNEVPAVLMVLIVILVKVQPFSD